MSLRVTTSNGTQFIVNEGQTVLEAALEQGVILPYSCKNGKCGVCRATLITGSISEIKPQSALFEKAYTDHSFLSCCCTASSDLVIKVEELTALRGIEIKTSPCRIKSITPATKNVLKIVLRIPPSQKIPFLEGQYLDITGPNGVRRSYSIANDSASNEFTLYIREVANGVLSNYWFYHAKENDLLRMEGPKGTFFLRGNHSRLIFLATGTGIAPIIAMLDCMENTLPDANNLEIHLYWGNRNPEDFFWQPGYKKLDLRYTPVISRADDSWQGRKGYIQDLLIADQIDLTSSEVYACGSLKMISAAKETLCAGGLPEAQFYFDAFVES